MFFGTQCIVLMTDSPASRSKNRSRMHHVWVYLYSSIKRFHSRVRFLRFFSKSKNATFTLFEVSCQKNVKNVAYKALSTLKLLADTQCKTVSLHTCHVIHTALY